MTVKEIGTRLVELCKQGKNDEAMKELYHPEIVSVEAGAPPGKSPECQGLDAVLQKSKEFSAAHEIHGAKTEGPFPNGDKFAVIFDYDVTFKPMNQRMRMHEVALYTVKNDKIVREEFYYSMG